VTRPVFVTGALLVALGAAVFLWKVLWLDLPIVPERARHLWGVELEVSARGIGGLGSVRAVLPATDRGQVVVDERASSDRLSFTIRQEGDERIGVWSGRFAGTRHVMHGFRVDLPERSFELDPTAAPDVPESIAERYGASSAAYPWLAADVADLMDTLDLPPESDPAGRLLTLFAFVTEEVAQAAAGTGDALLTLQAREGSLVGRVRLLVSLLRRIAEVSWCEGTGGIFMAADRAEGARGGGPGISRAYLADYFGPIGEASQAHEEGGTPAALKAV